MRRDETTKLNEQIVHSQRRDRTITETVNAAIDEWQRGGNIMAGVGVSAALGNALGIGAALGGGYSTSSGSRDIAASTVQKLNDNISQASSAMRELQSTIVVQSTQAEKEAVETRTVVNYNHSHALTILYYEVLRHFRIVASLAEVRPVILVEEPALDFAEDDHVINHRFLLEQALLDERLRPCFGAVDKLICLRAEREAAEKSAVKNFRFFQFHMEWLTGFDWEHTGQLRFALVLKDGSLVKLNRVAPAGPELDEHRGLPFTVVLVPPENGEGGGGYADSYLRPENGGISYGSIQALRVRFAGQDHARGPRTPFKLGSWILGALRLHGTHAEGEHLIFEGILNKYLEVVPGGPQWAEYDIGVWSPSEQLLPPTKASANHFDLAESDRCCFVRLISHLSAHKAHYNRFLRLNEDIDARAIRFAGVPAQDGRSLLDFIENRPLATVGNAVAFPCADLELASRINANLPPSNQATALAREKLVTLPTRGIFAEAKLGHCNASEEIDPNRFWDWAKSPIPHLAPEIAPTQTITPQPQQQNLLPTAFPQSLVNIVAPPNAPDPQGLASALTALATTNIFRDMSGRAEIADLLKKLSDNSVGIVEASSKAREILANQATAPVTASTPAAPPPTPKTPEHPQTPEQREAQHLNNQDKVLQLSDKLPPPNKKKVQEHVTKELTTPARPWRINLTSEWAGETIKQPMEAIYSGQIYFDDIPAEEGGLFIPDRFTNAVASWDVKEKGIPTHLSILAREIRPINTALAVKVPGLTIEDLTLQARDYSVPLRATGDVLPVDKLTANCKVDRTKVIIENPTLNFEGTGIIAKRDIDVTIKVGVGGDLSADINSAFEGRDTFEIVKLAMSAALKGGVKTNINGEVAIKGTFEIVYLKGYELKHV